MDIDQLQRWLDRTHEALVRSLVSCGEPLGLIVSQSFSEPLTQMQLNQFHRSGERSSLVGGVTRIKEILNLHKTQATPSMRIVVREQCVAQPLSLLELRLSDVCTGWIDVGAQVARIRLDRARLLQVEFTPRMVKEFLSAQFTFLAVETYTTDLSTNVWYIDIRISESTSPQALKKLVDSVLTCPTLLQGVPSIYDYYMDTTTINGTSRTCIVTQGSNLHGVCGLDWVDPVHTTSNNILEVFKTLGIDAARRAIIYELSVVIESRYLPLIASYMCHTGTPRALTFAGLVQTQHTSSVKLASFERSLDSFLDAGLGAHYDNLHGVSEAVMLGKCVSSGTGAVDVKRSQADVHHRRQNPPVADCHPPPIPVDVDTYNLIDIPCDLMEPAYKRQKVTAHCTTKKDRNNNNSNNNNHNSNNNTYKSTQKPKTSTIGHDFVKKGDIFKPYRFKNTCSNRTA
jgi:DNA-directed RNA polymerase beta' subunit